MKCQNPECDNEIPAHRLKHNSHQMYCSRACAAAINTKRRSDDGGFFVLSKAGNDAQAKYKAEHGVVPGYEQRKAALQRPNRTNNRRRRLREEGL